MSASRRQSTWEFDDFQKALRSVESSLQTTDSASDPARGGSRTVADSGVHPTKSISEQLAAAGVRSPLIIVAEEPLRLQRLVSYIHERLFSADPQAILQAHGVPLNQTPELSSFLGELRTPSLFSGPQLVVIWNGEKLKAAAEKAVAEAIARPLPQQVLVIAVQAEAKKALPLPSLREIGSTVSIPSLEGEALRRWIVKEVERFDVCRSIDPKVADLLARSFEENLAGLAGEIRRLSLVAGKNAIIESKHLQGSALPSQDQPSNDLTKSLLRGDSGSAAVIARNLLESGLHPLQISAQLSKAFRAILAERGHSLPLHKDVNAPWLTRQLGPTRNISEARLIGGLEILKDLDMALKDSGLEAEDSLKLAIEKLCRAGREKR